MRFLSVLATAFFATPSVFAADFPKFKTQEIDKGLKIGYAVLTTDINGDKKPDIVVVDQHQVVWYENPTWKKRMILDGKTKPDNVCAAAVDIDGDGLPEIVLGSAWKPSDTINPAHSRGSNAANRSTTNGRCTSCRATSRRSTACGRSISMATASPRSSMFPLQGKGATAKGNYTDGRPVRVMASKIPAKDPEKKENWKTEVLSEELHVCHNFWPFDRKSFVDRWSREPYFLTSTSPVTKGLTSSLRGEKISGQQAR